MREYELEVLEQYDVEVISTRKIRGAFFCETNKGTMVLKEARISEGRALLLHTMLEYLETQGYSNVDTPIFNKEKHLISVSRDQTRYLLKKWYSGRECDVRREGDVLEAARGLARLHQKMCWEKASAASQEEMQSLPKGRHLRDEFLHRNRELKKVRAYIRDKVNKNEFEYLYLAHFDEMYRLAMQVTQRLEQSEYENLYQESIKQKFLVHGDYNYHNILMCGGNTDSALPAVTNFEHFHMDVQVLDLYYFFRKVMEKHKWKETLGRMVLKAYEEIRPLDSRELEVLALKSAYPEKFWKTANAYYHSNKAWIPEKSVEKLETAIWQTGEKIRFLEKILTFFL